MKTIIKKPSSATISQAAQILKSGGVIAAATDTLYGLLAAATNKDAINNIYKIKGRPENKPLILLFSDAQMLKDYVSEFPPLAQKLANKFWPGALTIILSKGKKVIPQVCAGKQTVGVRIPNNDTLRKIIKQLGEPVCGPSANTSGKNPPISATQVMSDLGGKFELIVDDGPCELKVASTIVDVTSDNIKILRHGAISDEQIFNATEN